MRKFFFQYSITTPNGITLKPLPEQKMAKMFNKLTETNDAHKSLTAAHPMNQGPSPAQLILCRVIVHSLVQSLLADIPRQGRSCYLWDR